MAKNIFYFCLLFYSHTAYSQAEQSWKTRIRTSDKWAAAVNKFVGPRYVLLEENYGRCMYEEIDLDKDGVRELVVSVVDTAETESGIEKNKIFVFSISGDQLIMLDSSAAYETDGRGPHIEIREDSLLYHHSFHRGYGDLVYKFNRAVHKYKLVQVGYFVMERFKAAPTMNEFWDFTEKYDVASQRLIVKSENGDEEEGEKVIRKRRIFQKPLPKTISVWLSGLRDPNEDYDYFEPILGLSKSQYKYFEY